MKRTLDESKPIFLQIKEQLEDSIINETIQQGERVPSTNEFAAFYEINPATAAKGVNQLVDEGILRKRRGVGMFVTQEAKSILIEKRKKTFYDNYVKPLKSEAAKLNINNEQLVELVKRGGEFGEN
ncbi:GntR family transcriptional regulator [Oceanobacillus halotolerans]|uniref:GntR family transcriptional regulator n=1 Tax=Oceanobacillus halotolerans TaxID=2663380 RepID=UPI0013D90F83|nr:GntR family transcriptional regulator [Oceanobacillus halotolerans]